MKPIQHIVAALASQQMTQPQREALIDLAVWTMYVDGAIKHEENEQVDAIVESLSTAAGTSLRPYWYTAIDKVRDLWNDAERQNPFLGTISERLGDPVLRGMAYTLCETITRADDDLADTEQVFLDRVRLQFGL